MVAVSFENMLARLTAQSASMEPIVPNGKSELTPAEIAMIASRAPRMSFHALMVKYCHDANSLKSLYIWLHNTSLTDWFLNPENRQATIQVDQANRLVELSIIGWFDQTAKESATLVSRAAFVGANHKTFQRRYQTHYSYLEGELGFLEAIGLREIKRAMADEPE